MRTSSPLLVACVLLFSAAEVRAQDPAAAVKTLMSEATALVASPSCAGYRSASNLASGALELANRHPELATKADSIQKFIGRLSARLTLCGLTPGGGGGSGGGGIKTGKEPPAFVVGGSGRCSSCSSAPPDIIAYYLASDAERSLIQRIATPEFADALRKWTNGNAGVVKELESLRELGLPASEATRIKEGRPFDFTPGAARDLDAFGKSKESLRGKVDLSGAKAAISGGKPPMDREDPRR